MSNSLANNPNSFSSKHQMLMHSCLIQLNIEKVTNALGIGSIEKNIFFILLLFLRVENFIVTLYCIGKSLVYPGV